MQPHSTDNNSLPRRHRNLLPLTGLHHTPVLLLRSAQNRYEIFALRTFALSVWEWLTDAALPWGYDITAYQLDVVQDAGAFPLMGALLPMMTQRDPWVNLLRTTIACFAAALAVAEPPQAALFYRPFGIDAGRELRGHAREPTNRAKIRLS
jgi:hypothetical protein